MSIKMEKDFSNFAPKQNIQSYEYAIRQIDPQFCYLPDVIHKENRELVGEKGNIELEKIKNKKKKKSLVKTYVYRLARDPNKRRILIRTAKYYKIASKSVNIIGKYLIWQKEGIKTRSKVGDVYTGDKLSKVLRAESNENLSFKNIFDSYTANPNSQDQKIEFRDSIIKLMESNQSISLALDSVLPGKIKIPPSPPKPKKK